MPDDLESHLRELKPRSLPSSWRRQILAACAGASRESGLRRFLRFLNPGPAPAAALGLLWLLILGFFLNTPADPPSLPSHLNEVALREAQRERQMILAQLNGIDREETPGAIFARPLQRKESVP